MQLLKSWMLPIPALLVSGCSFMSHEADKKIDPKAEAAQTISSRVQRHIASIEEQKASLDPKKKNICTITINSTNERDAFRKRLPAKDFNFIELAPTEYAEREWFLNACRAGIKCDVVLISGHFGGTFFGETSPAKLALEDLEEYACRSECDGILSHPKEVFLFGCNTLAGKRKDSRTPEEYVRVLVADGFTQSQAEQVAAFRYSPLGSTNEARMTQAFKGATKIYGFDSKAPLGRAVDSSVHSYLRSIKSYDQHLDKLKRGQPNTQLAKAMKAFPFVESAGAVVVDRSPVCYLNNPHVSTMSKLSWIETTLKSSQGRLQNAMTIDRYLDNLLTDDTRLSDKEHDWIENIQHLAAAKAEIEQTLLKGLDGMLHAQAALANMMKRLRWWNAEEYRAGIKRILGGKFQSNITVEDRDLLCSLSLKIDLSPADLPPEPKKWSPLLLSAVACMRSSSLDLHQALYKLLREASDPIDVLIYSETLFRQDIKSHAFFKSVWEDFKSSTGDQAKALAMVLGRTSLDVPELHRDFLNTFKARSQSQSEMKFMALRLLEKARDPSPEMVTEVLRIVQTSDDPMAAYIASSVLSTWAPRNEALQMALVDLLEEGRHAEQAKTGLEKIQPKPEWMQQRLFKMVRSSENKEVYSPAAQLLATEYSLPVSVLRQVLELLKTSQDQQRKDTASQLLPVYRNMSEPDQFAAISLVSPTESLSVNSNILTALSHHRISSERVQAALIQNMVSITAFQVRFIISRALRNGSLTPASRAKLEKLANDSNKDPKLQNDPTLKKYAQEILESGPI